MKKLLAAALIVATAASSVAYAQTGPALATPLVNTKLNGRYHSTAAGTFWSNNQLPKGFSLAIEMQFEANTIRYHSVNDTDKAKPSGADWSAPLDGTIVPFPGQTRFDQISVLQLGPREFQVLEMKGNDVVVGQYWVFSADGKTLVRRGSGKAADGTTKWFQETFVRN